MRLRFLFTLGLVLFLSTLASSNECRRFCGNAAGCKAAREAENEAAGVQPSTAPTQSANGENSMLLVNKLLYI